MTRRRAPRNYSDSTSTRRTGRSPPGSGVSGRGFGGLSSSTTSGALSCTDVPASESAAELADARIARESHNVTIPTVEEGDWSTEDGRLSMLSFVAECHLMEIVE